MTDEPAPTPEPCPRCHGFGYDPLIPWPCSNVCDACGGRGYARTPGPSPAVESWNDGGDGRVHGPGDYHGPGGES